MRKYLLGIIPILFFLAATTTSYSQDLNARGNYEVKKISYDSAMLFNKAFEANGRFKKKMAKAMMIPMDVIDAIKSEANFDAIRIYFGKHPDYSMPVIIVVGVSNTNIRISKESLLKMSGLNLTAGGADGSSAYLVYYPCPNNCKTN